MSVNALPALSPIASHLANTLECVRRQAQDGYVVLDDGQMAFLVKARDRVLGELRGAEAAQLLARIMVAFAVKLLRVDRTMGDTHP